MAITLRAGTSSDAEACGEICFKAFTGVSDRHGFPRQFPRLEFAIRVVSVQLSEPNYYAVVAEIDGQIVGSNFLDERSDVAGVGPTTIDPSAQGSGVGRMLMEDVLKRASERRFPSVRLVQESYNTISLSLYTKLGFETRELLMLMQGRAPNEGTPGCAVRPALEDDYDACNAVSVRVHGHHRGGELLEAIRRETAAVVERNGSITGYTTSIALLGHSVGETDTDVQALIAAASEFPGPGFLLPIRQSRLLRWCLDKGIRIVSPMTLMSYGLYNEPKGAFLPSVKY